MIIVAAALARLRSLAVGTNVDAAGTCALDAFTIFAAACEHDRQRVAAAFRDCLAQFDADGACHA